MDIFIRIDNHIDRKLVRIIPIYIKKKDTETT